MSTYTEFHNKAGENLQIRNNPGGEDDRVSKQKVKLFNEENEYWGTFQKYDDLISQLSSGSSSISGEALSAAIKELRQDVSLSAHNLSNEVRRETRLRTESDVVISSSLSVISTDILIEIDELSMKLSTEIQSLSGSLSDEIQTLSTNLSTDIDSLSTRLSIEIDNLSSGSSSDISSLSSRLSSEIQTLSTSLSTDISHLSACLSSEIENLSTDLSHDIADLSDHLSSEIISLSTNLSNNVDDLSSDLSAEIMALSTSLSTEVSAKGYVTPFDYSFKYVDHEIVLSIWNANGQSVSSSINTAKFEEGRMLSSVDRIKEDGKWYLRLVFKLEDGSAKEVKIPLTDFLEIYKPGPGINIDLSTLTISADETIARLSDVNNQDSVLCGLILHNVSSINIISSEVIPYLSSEISSNDADIGFLSSQISSNLDCIIFISSEVSANDNDIQFLSNAISTKIWVEDLPEYSTVSGYSDLSVVKIKKEDYDAKVASGADQLSGSILYILDSPIIDAYGQVLSNLSTSGVDGVSQGANKGYVQAYVAATVNSLSISNVQLSSEETDVLSVITVVKEDKGKVDVEADVLKIKHVDQLCSVISSIDDSIQHKVFVSSDTFCQYTDLSVITIDKRTYDEMVISGLLSSLSNSIFIVSSDYIDAYGQQMKNLAAPTASADAATKQYVDVLSTSLSNNTSAEISGIYEAISNLSDSMSATVSASISSLSSTAQKNITDLSDSLSNSVTALVNTEQDARTENDKFLSSQISANDNDILFLSGQISSNSDNITYISSEVSSNNNDITLLSNQISTKIWVEDLPEYSDVSGYGDLSVIKIKKDDYEKKVATEPETVDGSTIYVVDANVIDAYGQQIVNLSTAGVDGVSNAANKAYVQAHVSNALASLSVGTITLSSESTDVLSSIITVRESNGKIELEAKPLEIKNIDQLCVALSDLNESIEHKIWISSVNVSQYDNLSVITIKRDAYDELLTEGKISSLSNSVFIISSDFIDAFGEQMKNLSGPTDENDAATKKYVDDISTSLSGTVSSIADSINQSIQDLSDSISATASADVYQLCCSLSSTISSSLTSLSASADKNVSDLSTSLSNSVTSLVDSEANIRRDADVYLSNQISTKIWIADPTIGLSSYGDLSVIKIDKTTYETGVATASPLICSNTIYVIEQANIDAYGQVLSNLRTPGVYEVSEAANTKYVDQKISKIVQTLSSETITLSSDSATSVITSIGEANGKISIEAKQLLSSDVGNLGGYVDDKFKVYTSTISAALSAVDKLSALTTDSVLEDVAQGVCDIRDMLSSLVAALKLMS